eukprot:2603910-Alexandrium_andersonii.AAC.1
MCSCMFRCVRACTCVDACARVLARTHMRSDVRMPLTLRLGDAMSNTFRPESATVCNPIAKLLGGVSLSLLLLLLRGHLGLRVLGHVVVRR